jgi:hypothetical protein
MSCTDEMFYVGIMSSGGREGGEDGFMAAMRVNVGGRKINSFHPPPQLFFYFFVFRLSGYIEYSRMASCFAFLNSPLDAARYMAE